MRSTRVFLTGSTVALLCALTACGSSTGSSPGSSSAAAPTTTGSASTSAAPAPTSAATNAPATASLKAELSLQGGDKPGLGMLAVTNGGSAPITFQGWPEPGFTNLAGERASVPVEQVPVPGEGPSITLQPGRTAFAGVLLNLGGDGSAIGSMDVEVPGAGTTPVTIIGTDGQPVTDTTSLKVSSVKVGTLQPVTQGVLVF
ncbi:DUF4232 domain-containing protein [Actinosynnema sp. NPDC050436]|uniref:DUF4232 domain-containing protein n=1 Tax=Actinosynnema sp. NPDC050436 TaxID=3155659 RepID=UPI0033FD56A5